MHRRWNRIVRVAAVLSTTAFAFGGCAQLLQNNLEALFAPAVLQNGFLLPFTFIFRLLTGGRI